MIDVDAEGREIDWKRVAYRLAKWDVTETDRETWTEEQLVELAWASIVADEETGSPGGGGTESATIASQDGGSSAGTPAVAPRVENKWLPDWCPTLIECATRHHNSNPCEACPYKDKPIQFFQPVPLSPPKRDENV